MPDAAEAAVEAKETDRMVALIIAILALLLALSEAGAKQAQHLSTEKNIEASDLFNFYQAKRIRSTVVETASKILEAQKTALTDAKAQDSFERQIGDFKTTVARFEKDTRNPEDSLEAIQERAKAGVEARELASRKLEHYEFSSGLTLPTPNELQGTVTKAGSGRFDALRTAYERPVGDIGRSILLYRTTQYSPTTCQGEILDLGN